MDAAVRAASARAPAHEHTDAKQTSPQQRCLEEGGGRRVVDSEFGVEDGREEGGGGSSEDQPLHGRLVSVAARKAEAHSRRDADSKRVRAKVRRRRRARKTGRRGRRARAGGTAGAARQGFFLQRPSVVVACAPESGMKILGLQELGVMIRARVEIIIAQPLAEMIDFVRTGETEKGNKRLRDGDRESGGAGGAETERRGKEGGTERDSDRDGEMKGRREGRGRRGGTWTAAIMAAITPTVLPLHRKNVFRLPKRSAASSCIAQHNPQSRRQPRA
eukprot:3026547-Rhodomonas_salina.2